MFAQPVPAESSRFELSQGHYWLTLRGLARNLRDFSHETMRDSVSREWAGEHFHFPGIEFWTRKPTIKTPHSTRQPW